MVRQNSGLIVFTSSPGGGHYCFGAAYGAHKAGMDKMAFDIGVDFTDAGAKVAAVSIWMGGLLTERVHAMMQATPEMFEHVKDTMETPEFTGEVIWAMFNDPDLMALNGKTVIGADMGPKYGITDLGGKYPVSIRERAGVVPFEFHPYKVKQ
jgi:NAD(P)-dependent dehydrogenase (short-subunit alcohol dehydrogenase family)